YGKINDGTAGTDGQVTNPTAFPNRQCKLPNYLSVDGALYVQAPNGSRVPVAIKGINWFGMETELSVPFGLWANPHNGTSLYEVVAFLARHHFNSIRLPLSVASLVANTPPNPHVVNTFESPALNLTTYVSTVQSIVAAAGAFGLSVLLDLHYLSPTDKGDAWFSDAFPTTTVLDAMDVLTAALCSDAYWNVLGVDLKNEPWDTTWGDDGPKDFRAGATLLANRMLRGCPSWLAFVEGNARTHSIVINDTAFDYYDWWGGGLQRAGDAPLALDVPAKVVWAPHYYSPSVYPQSFLVRGAMRVPGESVLADYTEWDDEPLRQIVAATAEDMFGYLRRQGSAVVFGEFGGLFALDAHPRKTSQRVIKACLALMMETGYVGGYMWALNPESGYGYNPSSTAGYWEEGLLRANWRDVNRDYLDALAVLDTMPHRQPFPCFTS
ncbi:cell 5A endo-1,4-betaglucanase, partial [Achlya hypogyna]